VPFISLHDMSFSGLAWTFKLLPSKHTDGMVTHLPVHCGDWYVVS